MSAAEGMLDLLKLAADAREAGRWKDAAALYRRQLEATPDDPDALCWYAFSLWQLDDLEGAVREYRRASVLAPTWEGIHNCLGRLNRQLGNTDDAIAEYRIAIKMAPYYAEAHANLAELLWSLGKLSEATIHYRRAIESEPEWEAMYEDLARILGEQDLLAEANMAAREAIRLSPARISAHGELAIILSKRRKHDEAEATLKSVLDLAPEDATLWSRLAWLRWRAERYEEATNAAREALWRNPALPYPHFLLGAIAAKRDERDSAIAHYRRYLELDPSDTEGATLGLSNLGVAPAPEKAPASYMKQLYAKRSTFWDEEIGNKTRYRAPMQIADALEHFMGPRQGLDIMDAGCGTGLCGPLLRARARRLDGIDLSPHMIEKAREKGVYDHLIEGDLESVLKAHPGEYDVIVSAATLLHFGDLAGPLGAAAGALRPGGWMAFTVFLHTGDGVGVLPSFCHAHSQEHVRDRAKGAGFEVVSIAEEIHEYQDDKPVPGLVVVLRRREKAGPA